MNVLSCCPDFFSASRICPRPRVVSAFVNSSSRPANAPLRTCNLASGNALGLLSMPVAVADEMVSAMSGAGGGGGGGVSSSAAASFGVELHSGCDVLSYGLGRLF